MIVAPVIVGPAPEEPGTVQRNSLKQENLQAEWKFGWVVALAAELPADPPEVLC